VEEPKLLLTSGKLDYKLVAGSKIAILNAAQGRLMGSLTKWAGGVPASSPKISELSDNFRDALAARLPPISTFQ
jgi:hypothetical protein